MDEAPQDEELPGADRRPFRRRARIALAAVALAAGLGAVVALVATRPDPRPDARPAPTAPTTSPTASAPVGPMSSPPPPLCLDVGGSSLNCGVSPTLPASTLAALRTLLPRATVVVASTVVGRSGQVVSRRATVRGSDGTTLQVAVGPPNGRYSVITVPSSVAPTLITFDLDVRRHHVALTYRARVVGGTPSVAALRRLADDPRLIAR